MQGWMSFWFDEEKRLAIAKKFQKSQIKFLIETWQKDKEIKGMLKGKFFKEFLGIFFFSDKSGYRHP